MTKFYIREKDAKKSVRFDFNYYLFNERSVWEFIKRHIINETYCAGRKTFYLDINL